jgi:hypothetical protein
LLRSGELSQRMIARQMGVSHATVNAIARGRRPDRSRRPRRDRVRLVSPSGPPRRCSRCGALVQMPCLACLLRAIQHSRRLEDRRN